MHEGVSDLVRSGRICCDRLVELAELGFDGVWIHHVGQQQERFIEVFGEHVVPPCAGRGRRGAARWIGAPTLNVPPRRSLVNNAIIYCLDVQTFADSDGDGIGDFGGLTQHVDDLAGLGVTCIWLMPFYPTADRDDGYDITDHYAIDPRLGTFGDFTEFMAVAEGPRAARDRRSRRQPHV